MAARNFDLAAKIYAELVEAVPNNPGLLLNLGMAGIWAGMTAMLLRTLQAALKIDPNIFPANLFLGASLLRSGEPGAGDRAAAEGGRNQPRLSRCSRHARRRAARLGPPRRSGRALPEARGVEAPAASGWVGLGQSYESARAGGFRRLEKDGARVGLHAGAVRQRACHAAAVCRARSISTARRSKRSPGMRGVHQALAEIYRRTEHPDWAAVEDQKEKALPPLHCAPREAERSNAPGADKRFEEVLRLAKGAEARRSRYTGRCAPTTGCLASRSASWASSGFSAAPRVDELRSASAQRALCRSSEELRDGPETGARTA